MSAEPLRAWLRTNRPDLTPQAIADACGCDVEMIRRWIKGKDGQHIIQDRSADLVLTRLGYPHVLRELYPELDTIAA